MDVLLMVGLAAACLFVAYRTYGGFLTGRVFGLDANARTPAHTERDGRDYVPTKRSILFGHHFTSIAGTGPIVGPAIAVMWGWLPALLWVVIGSIFVGAVHDLGSLVVSMRNKGRSIGDVAGDLLGPRIRLLFLLILIVGLWIVLAIFGLVIASVLRQYPQAVTPVLVQIPLAIIIGVALHRKGASIVLPSIVALVVMYASVVVGDWGPLHAFNAWMAQRPMWMWVVGLLGYSYVASVLPVWVLLQPRDYINALQLVSGIALIVAGLIGAAVLSPSPDPPGGTGVPPVSSLSSPDSSEDQPTRAASTGKGEQGDGVRTAGTAVPPGGGGGGGVHTAGTAVPPEAVEDDGGRRLSLVAPVVDWQPAGAPPLLPVLFITVACGACSGFHCLVSSGTSSKQIGREPDAKAVGYGAMLVEGLLATLVIAACAGGIGMGLDRAFDDWAKYAPGTKEPIERIDKAFVRAPDATWWVLAVDRHRDGGSTATVFDPDDRRTSPTDLDTVGSIDGYGASIVATAIAPGRLVVPSGAIDVPDREGFVLKGAIAFHTQYASWQDAGGLGRTVGAFVQGAANFLAAIGIPVAVGAALMAVMVASFAATTLDTACRLQRYVLQELASTFLPRREPFACRACGYDLHGGAGLRPAYSAEGGTAATKAVVNIADAGQRPAPPGTVTCPECGLTGPAHEVYHHDRDARFAAAAWCNPFKWLATVHGATLFAVVSAFLLAMWPVPTFDFSGVATVGAWFGAVGEQTLAWLDAGGTGGLILWPLFGATNQLLAGFAFVVITAWLRLKGKPVWFIVPSAALMLVIPASAMVWQAFIGNAQNPSWLAQDNWLLVTVASVTLALEAWLVVEVGLRWARRGVVGETERRSAEETE